MIPEIFRILAFGQINLVQVSFVQHFKILNDETELCFCLSYVPYD